MFILPAIDLFEKKAVRLYKGDYDRMTVYDEDPLHTAKLFEEAGATQIHMVDLEGARSGETPNIGVVESVVRNTSLEVEIGGGIRSMDVIRRYMEIGVSRVILGTAAVKDPDLVNEAVQAYGEGIAVGADIKDGHIAIRGWTETADDTLDGFCEKMERIGVRTLICTDISKDGAMQGTNRELYRYLKENSRMRLIASGGISSTEDLAVLSETGVWGAIIGKAYYTGAIDLKEAVAAFEKHSI